MEPQSYSATFQLSPVKGGKKGIAHKNAEINGGKGSWRKSKEEQRQPKKKDKYELNRKEISADDNRGMAEMSHRAR